jgi:hypothetical protein
LSENEKNNKQNTHYLTPLSLETSI